MKKNTLKTRIIAGMLMIIAAITVAASTTTFVSAAEVSGHTSYTYRMNDENTTKKKTVTQNLASRKNQRRRITEWWILK